LFEILQHIIHFGSRFITLGQSSADLCSIAYFFCVRLFPHGTAPDKRALTHKRNVTILFLIEAIKQTIGGRPGGVTLRGVCLAISAHLSIEKQNGTTTTRRRDVEAETFWIVPHLSLPGAPSLALLLFLISGRDLGAWLDYGVYVEFLSAPIPRKGSGSTTTTKQSSKKPFN